MSAVAEALTQGALIVEEPERGTLRVTGRDRASWLNGVVTCDVAAVSPKLGAFGLALSKTGKIQTDLWLVGTESELYLSTAGSDAEALRQHFERMLVMEDAGLEDASAGHLWIALYGPRAGELAESARARHGGASGEIDWTGRGGAALVVPRERSAAAIAELEQSGPDVRRASPEEWEAVRIEQGLPRFGRDYGPNDNPHDAALDQRAVCWTKGCYLGQEVVCMQGMRGKVKRRLVSLLLDSAEVPAAGAPVATEDGTEVGEVTTAARNGEGRAVAMARVVGAIADSRPALRVQAVPARIVERAGSA